MGNELKDLERRRKLRLFNTIFIVALIPLGIGIYFGVSERSLATGIGTFIGVFIAMLFLFALSVIGLKPGNVLWWRDMFNVGEREKDEDELFDNLKNGIKKSKSDDDQKKDYNSLLIDE